MGPQYVVQCLMIAPTIVLPISVLLKEEKILPVAPIQDQAQVIWKLACSRSVWQPMAFVFSLKLCQAPNTAWRQYLRTVLLFSDV